MDKEFIQHFSEVVREQLVANNSIQLENIGTFSQKHRKQSQQKYDDGRVVMRPPRNTIVFTPEKQKDHG